MNLIKTILPIKEKQSKQNQTKKENSSLKKAIDLNVTYNIINHNDQTKLYAYILIFIMFFIP